MRKHALRNASIIAIALLVAVIFSGCDDLFGDGDSFTISLSETTINLSPDDQVTLTVSFSPASAATSVIWATQNTSIATVSNGTVTGVGIGTTTISARAGVQIASCTVNVGYGFGTVSSLTVTPEELSISIDQTYQLDVVTDPADAADYLSWESDDTNVATVSAAGMVTGEGVGTATITITSLVDTSATDTVTVTVYDSNAATAAFNQGISLLSLSTPDIDGAYTKMAEALYYDQSCIPAAMWYSLITLANIAVDTDVVDFAQNTLGMWEYPETIPELFSTAWLDPTIGFPNVAGMIDYDGFFSGTADGTIDFTERLAAIAEAVITDSSFLNDTVDVIIGTIETRLGEVTDILSAICDDAAITLGPSMIAYGDYLSGTDIWPTDGSGNDLDITIGKDELSILAMGLGTIRASALLVQAIDLTFPLQTLWDAVDFSTFALDYSAVPAIFGDTFLELRDTAASTYADASQAYIDAFTMGIPALTAIADRSGSGFFLDAQNTDYLPTEFWGQFSDALQFEAILFGRVVDSIENDVDFIMPVNFNNFPEGPFAYYSYYSTEANWPDAIDITLVDDGFGGYELDADAAGINMAQLLSPYGGLSALLDMTVDGEPVWYTYDGTDFSVATYFADDLEYWFKVKDLTLGGAINPSNVPDIAQLNSAVGADSPMVFVWENADTELALYISLAQMGFPVSPAHSLVPIDGPFYIFGSEFTSVGSFWYAITGGGETIPSDGSLSSPVELTTDGVANAGQIGWKLSSCYYFVYDSANHYDINVSVTGGIGTAFVSILDSDDGYSPYSSNNLDSSYFGDDFDANLTVNSGVGHPYMLVRIYADVNLTYDITITATTP